MRTRWTNGGGPVSSRLEALYLGLPEGHPLKAQTADRLRRMGVDIPEPMDEERAAFLERWPLREKTDEEWEQEIDRAELDAVLDSLAAERQSTHRLWSGSKTTDEKYAKREERRQAQRERKELEPPDWAPVDEGQTCWFCGRVFAGNDSELWPIDGVHRFVCRRAETARCVPAPAPAPPPPRWGTERSNA